MCRLRKQPIPQGPLKRVELQKALHILTYINQQRYFSTWIGSLKESGGLVPRPYRTLQPFMDTFGIIRVGGRLRHSSLEQPAKIPILLSKDSHLSSLVLQYYH
jgi:hypothetical protein